MDEIKIRWASREFVFIASLFLVLTTTTIASKIFTASSISLSKYLSSGGQKETFQINSGLQSRAIYGMSFCHSFEWCTCFCETSPGTFVIANVILSPRIEDSSTDSIPCWTSIPEGEMIGELGTFSVVDSSEPKNPTRLVGNLLDGFYDFVLGNCYWTTPEPPTLPFVCFDMGATRTISKIKLYAQPNDNSANYFKEIYMKLGDTPQSGDFSSYETFDFFAGAAEGTEFIYESDVSTPMHGRYLAIQSIYEKLQLCHIEVY